MLDMDEALKRQCKIPVYMIGLSSLPKVVGYEPRLQRTASVTLCVRSTGTEYSSTQDDVQYSVLRMVHHAAHLTEGVPVHPSLLLLLLFCDQVDDRETIVPVGDFACSVCTSTTCFDDW